MSDHLLIFLIVILNALCQVMLIWRQKLETQTKWGFCCTAIAIPVVIMVTMRLLIAGGAIHERVADQSLVEQLITKGTSILLIAGPWLVTVAAIWAKMKNRTLLKRHASN